MVCARQRLSFREADVYLLGPNLLSMTGLARNSKSSDAGMRASLSRFYSSCTLGLCRVMVPVKTTALDQIVAEPAHSKLDTSFTLPNVGPNLRSQGLTPFLFTLVILLVDSIVWMV